MDLEMVRRGRWGKRLCDAGRRWPAAEAAPALVRDGQGKGNAGEISATSRVFPLPRGVIASAASPLPERIMPDREPTDPPLVPLFQRIAHALERPPPPDPPINN